MMDAAFDIRLTEALPRTQITRRKNFFTKNKSFALKDIWLLQQQPIEAILRVLRVVQNVPRSQIKRHKEYGHP